MKNRIIICLGLSLSLLVGIFVLWGGFPLAQVTGLGISDILKLWSIPSLLGMVLALFLTLLIKGLPTKAFLWSAPLLASVFLLGGFALLLLLGPQHDIRVPVMCTSAVFSGFGYSTLFILWQHYLAQLSREGVAKILLLSLVISSAAHLLISLILPSAAWYAFPLIVLAALVTCLLAAQLPALREDELQVPTHKIKMTRTTIIELRDPLLCVCAVVFAVALTRAIALDGIKDANMVNIVACIFIIVVSLVLYLMWFRFKKGTEQFSKSNILSLYQISFPLIATALLVLSVVGSALSLAVTTLVYVVYSLVSVFMMSTSIEIARKHKVWPSYVYGIFAGIVNLVFALATALGAWVYYPKNFGAATLSIIVLAVLYILAMSYVAVKNRKKRDEGEGAQGALDRLEDGAISAAPATDAETGLPSAEPTVIDEVAQRCSVLTEKNQLTTRESETLLLLARGRDVPSIAKQLYISENTVRSHSKGVYRKLQIHSKQELLDLLETIDVT